MASQKFPRHLSKYKHLTKDVIDSLLHYDSRTGFFTWKWRDGEFLGWNIKYAGERAGGLTTKGYIRIGIKIKGINYRYLAHHLAWITMTGKFPILELDHRNNIKTDNCWKNLREVTTAQNCQNRYKHKGNTSGFRGVVWHKMAKAWAAQIKANGKNHWLGCFDSPEMASAAYQKMKKKLHINHRQ